MYSCNIKKLKVSTNLWFAATYFANIQQKLTFCFYLHCKTEHSAWPSTMYSCRSSWGALSKKVSNSLSMLRSVARQNSLWCTSLLSSIV